MTADQPSWRCVKCGEMVDAPLGCCWQCGAGRDGAIDDEFVHADQVRIPDAKEENARSKFGLRALLVCITCLCVVFAALRTDVGDLYVAAICGILLLAAAVLLYGFVYGLILGWVKRH